MVSFLLPSERVFKGGIFWKKLIFNLESLFHQVRKLEFHGSFFQIFDTQYMNDLNNSR